MLDKMYVSLEQTLRSLNSNIVLESAQGAHRVRTWLKDLNGKLGWDAQVKSDIYNEGRLEIHAFKEIIDGDSLGTTRIQRYGMYFYQRPITERALNLHRSVGTL